MSTRLIGANGIWLRTWGSSGNGNGQFNQPSGIAIVGDRVYVADTQNHRVQVFDLSGAYLSQFDGFGAQDGQFNLPLMIASDADGYLYISDHTNHRVQKFDPQGSHFRDDRRRGKRERQAQESIRRHG